jgi:L-lysine exporter family protein LysE/ArgO
MIMTMSTILLGKGIALGLGAAVPIGPVNVEIARRTFRGGFTAGFALGCGAVSVDVTYAILSSLSFRRLLDQPFIHWSITIGGVIFLLYLSFLSLRGAIRDLHADPLAVPRERVSHRNGYLTGVLMTLLNPMTVGFWFLAVPAALGSITKDPAPDMPMICVGVFMGTIAWVVSFAGALAWAGRWRKNWWLAAADVLGGVVLFCFAAVEVWRAARPAL